MTCPRCQAEVQEGSKFCATCGHPLESRPRKKPPEEKPPTDQPASPAAAPPQTTQKRRGSFLKMAGLGLGIVVLIGAGFLVKSALEKPAPETPAVASEKSKVASVSTTQDTKINLESLTLSVPKDAVAGAGNVELKVVSVDDAPPLTGEVALAGDIYQIETDVAMKSGQAAYITLSYNSTNFPSGTSEDNLYLTRHHGTGWEPVPGTVIDKESRTITAAVDEFSFFTVLVNLAKAVIQTDIIEPVSRFADLPDDIKIDLNDDYSQSSIKSGLRWRVSPLTRTASQTILAANFVNSISGGILTFIDGAEDAVTNWIAEELIKKLGHDILAELASDEAADMTIALYDTVDLGRELYSKGFKTIKNTAMLKAQIVAWVLAREMDYANANIQAAYSRIASLNLWSLVTEGDPLQLYVISVEGENLKTGQYDIGLKFYYFDDQKLSWNNYANNVLAIELAEAAALGMAGPAEGESAKPTLTPTPSPTPVVVSGCQNVDLSNVNTNYQIDKTDKPCAGWNATKSTSSLTLSCDETSALFRLHGVKQISTGGFGTVRIKADLTLQEPAGLFPGGGVHYADYVDLLIYGELPDTLSTCGVSVNQDEWAKKCYALNQEDAAASDRTSTAFAHCGVPQNSTSVSCDFEVETGGRDKLYLVMATKDAWAYAKVIGGFSNIQVCR